MMNHSLDRNKILSNVVQEISEFDDMYQGNKEHYYQVGESALKCIELAYISANKEFSELQKILDFPCGYGRVLRVLNAAFPTADITACDLVHEGVDFCKDVLGAIPVYSDKNLDNIVLPSTYDLIWVGSLLTHLDSEQWPKFINFFSKSLNSGGILVFTTQGRWSAAKLRNGTSTYGLENASKINNLLSNYDKQGFGFSSYFHSDDYGISLSSPSFVIRMLEQRHDLGIIMSLERGWDNHQDVFACIKQ